MKNKLGYALFPGDYVVKMHMHDHYKGHEFFAKSQLITELLVNGITVARLNRHHKTHWLDHYPEDVEIYDDVEIVNPIQYDCHNNITYKIDDCYRNSKEEEVSGDCLFPYECIIELGNKIQKEGNDFWVFDKQINETQYHKEMHKDNEDTESETSNFISW